MGSLVIQLESTQLSDVLSKIGTGEIQHRGDAAESVYWLCYSVPSSANTARLWLMSGEMDGGAVGSIALRLTSSDETATPSCPELPQAYRSVKLGNNISLQNRASDLRRIFGKPSLAANGWLHFDSERDVLLRGEKYTELGGLSVRVIKDRIVELWVSKTTSN